MNEYLSPIVNNIYRFNNQLFYGEIVGTYLIALDDKIVLVDLPEFSTELLEYLKSYNKPAIAILSHGSCGVPSGTLWQKELGLKIYLHKNDEYHSWLRIKPDILFKDEIVFNNLQVIFTPGHSKGSVCILDNQSKTIFTGDTLGGTKENDVRNFLSENDDIAERIRAAENYLNMILKSLLLFIMRSLQKMPKKSSENFY